MLYSDFIESPIGRLTVKADDNALYEIAIDEEECAVSPNEITELAINELQMYFAGKLKEFTVPVCFNGTDFRCKVWRALCDIPYGKTATYGDISVAVCGSKRASRAVGGANHVNPIPIIVPCHRVVASSGIGGYSLGIDKKEILLKLEAGKLS